MEIENIASGHELLGGWYGDAGMVALQVILEDDVLVEMHNLEEMASGVTRNGGNEGCNWIWYIIFFDGVIPSSLASHEVMESLDFLIGETKTEPSLNDGSVAVDEVEGVSDDVLVGEGILIGEMADSMIFAI